MKLTEMNEALNSDLWLAVIGTQTPAQRLEDLTEAGMTIHEDMKEATIEAIFHGLDLGEFTRDDLIFALVKTIEEAPKLPSLLEAEDLLRRAAACLPEGSPLAVRAEDVAETTMRQRITNELKGHEARAKAGGLFLDVCAYCGGVISERAEPKGWGISHGCCPACYEAEKAREGGGTHMGRGDE